MTSANMKFKGLMAPVFTAFNNDEYLKENQFNINLIFTNFQYFQNSKC